MNSWLTKNSGLFYKPEKLRNFPNPEEDNYWLSFDLVLVDKIATLFINSSVISFLFKHPNKIFIALNCNLGSLSIMKFNCLKLC